MRIIQGSFQAPEYPQDKHIELGVRPSAVFLVLGNPISVMGTYSAVLPFNVALLTDVPCSVGYTSSSSVSYNTLGFLDNNGFTVRNSNSNNAFTSYYKYIAFIEED